MKCTLTIYENGRAREIETETGVRLLDALSRADAALTAPCGGRGRCGKCAVRAEGALQTLPGDCAHTPPDGMRLACRTLVTGDARVYLDAGGAEILATGASASVEADGEDGLGVAVDVGTTTLAAYLLSLKTGAVLATDTMLNPQRLHGSDVISRLSFAMASDENARMLQKEALDALSEMTDALLAKADLAGANVKSRACVGNTVMMHLLGGYPARGLAAAPFSPAYTNQHRLRLGGVDTLLGGCVSGYVGADTVAAMLACDLDHKNETSILIDIGTNGEIAAMKNGNIACCSCAAGPAFEGAHIACGTGAVAGAIDHAEMQDGRMRFTTVGGAPARGICGSGLIDLVAALLENDVISKAGRMAENFPLAEGVYLAREDVREVQLAKAAIAAGIRILMDDLSIADDEVENLYLAGGFGNYICVPNACKIGMLPPALEKRVKCVGNAAGEGAKRLLIRADMRARAEALRARMRYIELAARPEFTDLYAENLLFGEDE